MRPLSQEELELITGGIETITVIGSRIYEDWSWTSPYIPSDPYDNPGGSGSGGSGGSDPGPAPSMCRLTDPFSTRIYSNELSSELARQIVNMPNYRGIEYLGFIYRDSGGALRSSGLIEGHSQGASFDPGRFGIAYDQVVGFIHNHPYDTYARDETLGLRSPLALINRNPSNNDWDAADRLVAGGANASTLTLYVIAPDNQLREFAYSDKNNYYNPSKSTTPGPTVPQDLQPSSCN